MDKKINGSECEGLNSVPCPHNIKSWDEEEVSICRPCVVYPGVISHSRIPEATKTEIEVETKPEAETYVQSETETETEAEKRQRQPQRQG